MDDKDNPLFVIQGDIPVESAGILWSDLPLYPGSRVGLMRNDGYLQLIWPVYDPERTYSKSQSGALIHAMRTNPGKVAGYFEGTSTIDGEARFGAYVHLPNANMSAFVSVPRRLILSRWWENNYPVLLSFIGYLTVIGVIAYRLSEREKQHTHDLLVQARKDPLTGLPNRIAIDELIVREIARARRSGNPMAMLYLDVDEFKDVNDSFGHAIGDRLLERIAARMLGILRGEDILSRLGGDEFLILIPNSSVEKAGNVAQRIIDTFTSPVQVGEREIPVSTSIGICMYPDNGADVGELLQNADAAMYEAKRRGRNCFAFYREELGEYIRKRLKLRDALEQALEREEFVLYYQPLIDMPSGKIVGAEALLRWSDPRQGLRNPAEFIPFAEETGLILPLGEWALRAACRQGKLWAAQGFNLYVAVNLSTRQFQDADLLDKIHGALAESQLPASGLELEITETASMLDPEASINVMGKLQSLGIRLAIDDFGTGYSSLSYLKRIPADIIKIDRSFVSGLDSDQHDLAIVRTIVTLGESLGKHCLAEGIETREHFEVLRSLGCRYGQGYWMSKPLPAKGLEDLLAKDKSYLHPAAQDRGATARGHETQRLGP